MPFVRANDILFDEGLTPEKCALKTLLRWPIKIVNSVHKSKQIKNYSQIISSYYQILLAEPHFDILCLAFAAGGLWE